MLCEANFYSALLAELKKDMKTRNADLQKVLDTKVVYFTEYDLAKFMLAQRNSAELTGAFATAYAGFRNPPKCSALTSCPTARPMASRLSIWLIASSFCTSSGFRFPSPIVSSPFWLRSAL